MRQDVWLQGVHVLRRDTQESVGVPLEGKYFQDSQEEGCCLRGARHVWPDATAAATTTVLPLGLVNRAAPH